MINLATLLHRTPTKIHRNSQNCSATITSSTMNADDNGAYYFVRLKAMDRTTTRKTYKIIAKMYVNRDGSLPNNPKIFIWCACAWFKFHCEVALAIRGSSYIANSNGALPKITNPTARPQCCKHCLAAIRKMRSQPMKIKTKAREESNDRDRSSSERSDDRLNDLLERNRRSDRSRIRREIGVPRSIDLRERNL
jgi:hypothetical protein